MGPIKSYLSTVVIPQVTTRKCCMSVPKHICKNVQFMSWLWPCEWDYFTDTRWQFKFQGTCYHTVNVCWLSHAQTCCKTGRANILGLFKHKKFFRATLFEKQIQEINKPYSPKVQKHGMKVKWKYACQYFKEQWRLCPFCSCEWTWHPFHSIKGHFTLNSYSWDSDRH